MVYYCCLRHTEKYENYKYESKKFPKVAHLNLMSLYFETLFKRDRTHRKPHRSALVYYQNLFHFYFMLMSKIY